ncbi:hypothetical protein H6P81_015034 [Aristolochia fimbriata]|uniref:Cytochrome P450 n=1 Tax=Aristolochia fimbriata TaxID=158543 RepID=A0AAV7E667_ARIFI|nr:hypothetical protein H6P81_015034 [Aristolochia fimbriata]
MALLISIGASTLLFVVLLFYIHLRDHRKKSKEEAPEPGMRLPLLGHILLLLQGLPHPQRVSPPLSAGTPTRTSRSHRRLQGGELPRSGGNDRPRQRQEDTEGSGRVQRRTARVSTREISEREQRHRPTGAALRSAPVRLRQASLSRCESGDENHGAHFSSTGSGFSVGSTSGL